VDVESNCLGFNFLLDEEQKRAAAADRICESKLCQEFTNLLQAHAALKRARAEDEPRESREAALASISTLLPRI
jgi:hypothetical protein